MATDSLSTTRLWLKERKDRSSMMHDDTLPQCKERFDNVHSGLDDIHQRMGTIIGKLDEMDKFIRNGLSLTVHSVSTQVKFQWAVLAILITANVAAVAFMWRIIFLEIGS
jgi:hypothetical protein